MAKDYGVGVSGVLEPSGYNWETTVYQASKPVLDKELNLIQDQNQEWNRSIFRLAVSGWLSPGVVESSVGAPYYQASTTANELVLQGLAALVNGWAITVNNTGENGTSVGLNSIDLGAGPAGVGAIRTDLVVLEVWRFLVSGGVALGLSPAGRVWLNGNVKINAADDVALNLADDIIDGAVGAETTKRVQIQYRLRVIPGVDLDAHPFGISDPSVVAHSSPTAPATPDGAATLFTYSRSSSDQGLWVAGDGIPSNTLGTVDGYMYALPVCAVFRRNTSAFAKTNHNGGVASPGPSDRPDGYFHDIIELPDIMDLTHAISTTGWDFNELLQKNVNYLFDNDLRTEHGTDSLGGNLQGHTQITADEIGPADTAGANLIREADSVVRRYSDRSIVETVVLRYSPTDASGGGPTWAANDIISIDMTALPIHPYTPANLASVAPANISLLDIKYMFYVDETGGGITPVIAFGDIPDVGEFPPGYQINTVNGFGQVPQGTVQVELFINPGFETIHTLFIVAVIEYPAGEGLTYTPTQDFGVADSLVIETPAQLPVGAPINYAAIEDFSVDPQHREVEITYRTNEITYEYHYFDFHGSSYADLTNVVLLPERAAVVNEIRRVSPNPATYTGGITLSADGRVITLDPAAGNWGGNALNQDNNLEIDYEGVRPIPNNSVQMTIWYEKRAPQTIRDSILGSTLSVIPRYVAPYMYTLVGGSGTQDDSYPFPVAYTQSPGVYPTSGGTFSGDHELDSYGEVSIADFNINTGFLQVPTLVPAVPNPQSLVFDRSPGDIDAENRTYFKEVPAGYIPSAFGQPLSDAKTHKNVLPIIAEITTDSVIGPKGSLVLVLISRWAPFDAANNVAFDSDLAQNLTSASVYRLKGNPLASRRF